MYIIGVLISVYTSPERVSSCEIMSGGWHIALALESQTDLVTLKLIGGEAPPATSDQDRSYGNPENEGKVFDLRDKEI